MAGPNKLLKLLNQNLNTGLLQSTNSWG